MLLGLNPAVLALIGTIIATVGVKILERWLGKADRSTTDAAQIRLELKEQVASYKEEIRRLEDEVDEWRGKYYAVMEELVAKRIELQNALDQIKKLSEDAAARAAEAQTMIKNGPPHTTELDS